MPKSHILLPESTMKRFSKSGIFNCLNLISGKISWSRACNYETADDYYPPEIEEYLSKKIERPIGQWNKEIEQFSVNRGSLAFDNQTKESIILWCVIQMLRVPDLAQITKEKSFWGRFFEIDDDYFSPLRNPDNNFLNIIKQFENMFADYDVNLCIVGDKCNNSFLLPSLHWFGADNGMIFFVMAPRSAFVLLPKEINMKYCEGDTTKHFVINDEKIMRSYYARELVSERKWKKPVLIGYKQDLLVAQEILKILPPTNA